MSRIYVDNAQSVGNTPLVQINRLGPKGVTILAKIESRNPAGSVKCRSREIGRASCRERV